MQNKLNKPKYNIFKNIGYTIDGLKDLIENEASFRLEIVLFVIFSFIAWLLPITMIQSSILFISLFIPILAEIINSAIERIVDLITHDYHLLAKKAKDMGATLVLFSTILTAFIWFFVLIFSFNIFQNTAS